MKSSELLPSGGKCSATLSRSLIDFLPIRVSIRVSRMNLPAFLRTMSRKSAVLSPRDPFASHFVQLLRSHDLDLAGVGTHRLNVKINIEKFPDDFHVGDRVTG